MLCGIDQTQLFFDDRDRVEFLERLERLKVECGFGVFAYCLMGNHVHLLIAEEKGELSQIIKRLALSYTHYFNARYDRSGYLFQGRFKSEPVEDEDYLPAVFAYIHSNPVRVGLPVNSWTSYDELVGATPVRLVDANRALGMLGIGAAAAREELDALIDSMLKGSGRGGVMESKGMLGAARRRPSDAEAIEIIKEMGGMGFCGRLAGAQREERNRVLATLKQRGLSIRQIARLTGLNRGIVQEAGN
jgi:REP element-mobilizing transposase RayT